MPSNMLIVSQAVWTEVITQLAILIAKINNIEGGVKILMKQQLEVHDRHVQELLDAFE